VSESMEIVKPDPRTQNVLAPVRAVAGRLSAFHVLSYSAITIDVPNESYSLEGGRALLKSALMKMAAAAGIRIVESKPIGVPTPDYLIWQVAAEMPLTGQEPVKSIGTYEWDATVMLDGKQGKAALKIRQSRLMMAESKAMNRAIRMLLGIKSKYTAQELQKPFIIPHVDYQPDIENPAVRQIMAARQEQAVLSLYGADHAAGAEVPMIADEDYDPDDDGIIDGDYVIDDGRTINTATGEVVDTKPEVTTEICAADTTIQKATPEPAEEKGASAAERQAFGDLMGYTLKFTDQKGQTLRQVFDNKAEGMGMAWLKAASDFYATDHHKFQNPDTLTEFENIAEFYRIALKAGL